jgi:hypothetical protein
MRLSDFGGTGLGTMFATEIRKKRGFGNRGHGEAGQGRSAQVSEGVMKKCGQPRSVVTDGLCSYPGVMKEIGNADRQSRGELAPAISTARTSHAALSACEDTTKVQFNSRSGPQSWSTIISTRSVISCEPRAL